LPFSVSVDRILQKYLIVWLVALSLLAWCWPELWSAVHAHLPAGLAGAVRADFDPFVETKKSGGEDQPWLTVLIVATMFCVGALLPADEVRQLARKWSSVLGGTCVQYISMPLLAWSLARAFQLPPDLTRGVVLVGCVPGAMASNVLTLAGKGNVSYSVSLTTLATLVSPIVVPLALGLTLGESVKMEVLTAASRELLLEVVLPVVIGFTLCRLSVAFAGLMQRIGATIANLSILWIIAVVVGLSRDRLSETTSLILVVLLALNVLGYLAGFAGGSLLRLSPAMRRALTLEVGMQNAGVGAKLAVDLFKDTPTVAIPPAAYAFGCMLTGTILVQVLMWRDARRGGRGDVSGES
jgi:bile acid:Na+ symporter, BASS family